MAGIGPVGAWARGTHGVRKAQIEPERPEKWSVPEVMGGGMERKRPTKGSSSQNGVGYKIVHLEEDE